MRVPIIDTITRPHQVSSASPDHEARKWDALGKKVYSSASLGVWVSSYMAHFSQYDHELWSEVAVLADLLPEHKREDVRCLAADGLEISRALMQGTWDLGDTTARGVAEGVSIRRLTWLKGSGFSAEVQHWIADLPFSGGLLFGKQAEIAHQQLKETKSTIRSLAPLRPSMGPCPPSFPQGGTKRPYPWARLRLPSNGGDLPNRGKGLPRRVKPKCPGTPSRNFDRRLEHCTAPPRPASQTFPPADACPPSRPGRPYHPISGSWR
nr:PREDICTED: uncharacterized protein LOC106706692 [Latimeria chalumnae]|eukprot:XP_014353464.1 PREDICTED: uncharacterized protein LOC106706692 [Latimeria chalumnae]